MQLQLKVNGTFRSIIKILVVTKKEKEELKSVLNDSIHQLYFHYSEMDVSNMFIRHTPGPRPVGRFLVKLGLGQKDENVW